MGRPKKKTSTPKVKQLVRIRFKLLANGEQSIYLDIYKEGKRAYEFLKDDEGKSLRLLPETGTPNEVKAVKARNHKILLQAESIRVAKEKEVVELGKVEKQVTDLGKMLLKDWLEQYRIFSTKVYSIAKGKQISAATYHIKNWLGTRFDTMQMQNVDTEFCRAFLQYLQDFSKISKRDNTTIFTLSQNTLNQIYVTLRGCFNRAVREGIMQVNPTDKMVVDGDFPKRIKVQKTFLTTEEVKMLMKTNCKNELVKRAFLFGCFTGLRISDIYKLKWEDIKTDGLNYRLQVTMKKTKTPLYMKLNSQALACLPSKDNVLESDNVFSGLPTLVAINKWLVRWSNEAGIKGKHISFHTSRHTFGTLMLNSGTDIYTVSKLMGHKSLETTQVYVELLNQTRDQAVDRLSEIFKGVEGD
ncbi:MAG: site-specific integrase [Lachnospiraceae bacterium]|nr:site-specific integrase [Lachnospiraceae bacterium]